ncbi:MAG: hypothetical protein EB072_06785 [Betaproteobacteria bacterium]|nr:hypothetical protein [Betaproteobacteria bacterium]
MVPEMDINRLLRWGAPLLAMGVLQTTQCMTVYSQFGTPTTELESMRRMLAVFLPIGENMTFGLQRHRALAQAQGIGSGLHMHLSASGQG